MRRGINGGPVWTLLPELKVGSVGWLGERRFSPGYWSCCACGVERDAEAECENTWLFDGSGWWRYPAIG